MLHHQQTDLPREHGFTLIELIVVLFILGLLIAVALPSYYQARQTAGQDEARTLGQEWRTLEWACYQTQGVTSTCSTDALIGFSEGGTNWNFGNTSFAYGFATGTVTRCANAVTGTNVAGNRYELTLTVTGTGAGTASDQFLAGLNACP